MHGGVSWHIFARSQKKNAWNSRNKNRWAMDLLLIQYESYFFWISSVSSEREPNHIIKKRNLNCSKLFWYFQCSMLALLCVTNCYKSDLNAQCSFTGTEIIFFLNHWSGLGPAIHHWLKWLQSICQIPWTALKILGIIIDQTFSSVSDLGQTCWKRRADCENWKLNHSSSFFICKVVTKWKF